MSESLLPNLATVSTSSQGAARTYSGAGLNTPPADYRLSPLGYGAIQQQLSPPALLRQTSTEKMDFLAGRNDSKQDSSHHMLKILTEVTDVASMQQAQQSQARNIHSSMSVQDLPRSPQP